MHRERYKVRSIEIENPVEVTFLDRNEHDVILCAEREALEAVNAQRKEIEEGGIGGDYSAHQNIVRSIEDTDDVEVVHTVKEHGDQHIQRKIETKSFISEDPNTKRKITKVVKTETTEITKIYHIETDEDARNLALELGLKDMSQIIADGGTSKRSHWQQPQILKGSYRRTGDEDKLPQGEFVLVSSDGTQIPESYLRHDKEKSNDTAIKSTCLETSRLASLCNCTARRRKDEKPRKKTDDKLKKETKSTGEVSRPISIRKRIQESSKRLSMAENVPLIDKQRKNVIEHNNLQLSTFIFDIMCKLGLYNTEKEKSRGRKVISRALDLLYYNRCKTWPEYTNQLVNENEEYTETNHIVIPTANVIEYIMTSYPDLIGLIDSVPDENLLNDLKTYADRPFTKLPAMDSIDLKGITSSSYEEAKVKKLSHPVYDTDKSKHYDIPIEKASISSELPTAHLLSIISDHDHLIPHDNRTGEHGHLPDVVASPQHAPHICSIIEDNSNLSKMKTPKAKHHDKRHNVCHGRCFSCFSGETKRKASIRKQKDELEKHVILSKESTKHIGEETKRLDAPAVHWPSITVGNLPSYDTPDIILIEKHPKKVRSKLEIEVTGKPEDSILSEKHVKDKKYNDTPVMPEINDTPTHAMLQRNDESIESELTKEKIDDTIDALAKGAIVAAEMRVDETKLDEPFQKPHQIPIMHVVVKPQPKQHANIRKILECHKCMPCKERVTIDKEHVDRREVNMPEIKHHKESPQSTVEKICGIISCHRVMSSKGKTMKDPSNQCSENICNIIRFHSQPSHAQYSYKDRKPIEGEKYTNRKSTIGGLCTKCFTLKSNEKHSKKVKKRSKSTEQFVVSDPSSMKTKRQSGEIPTRTQKLNINVPSFQLPDIPLSSGRNHLLEMPDVYLDMFRKRLNQIFPGENADQLLDEICFELNNGEPLDKIRTKLIGRYPLAMIDLVILSMSFVERDYDAGLIGKNEVSDALVKVLDDNRKLYSAESTVIRPTVKPVQIDSTRSSSVDTQTVLPAGGGQSKFQTVRPPSKCFSCTSEKTIPVPMSPDCINILEALQKLPLSQLPNLGNRISNRMKITWNIDKTNSNEVAKIVKRILPKFRDGQVASTLLLSNDLKNESPKFFYVVDPCIDVIQLLTSKYDLSKPITDADIDVVLREVGDKYAGVGMFRRYQCPSNVAWIFQPDNIRSLIDTTERRIISSSSDPTLQRKHKKLNKIIQDAFSLMAKRQVANTTDLRSQLHRLYPKDSILVEHVLFDIEEGIRSGRLQQECGHSSVRILINILHSKDLESCRIQNGEEMLLSDRAFNNLKQNKHLLVQVLKSIIIDAKNCKDLDKVRSEENLDEIIDYALDNVTNIKAFDELTAMVKSKCKNECTADVIVMLIEQAYFATEFENPDGKDAVSLMIDRLHGKPLVLREICFAIPDKAIIGCKDHRGNYSLTTSPTGKLISIGQGLSWREANERARILFYRGRKPAVRYNDVLEGFDVRMILEQDGCIHEIPVSPDDVKRLLNSCGLYWDGLNISLLCKSDEVIHRAEQEAFKILRETGFLYNSETAKKDSSHEEINLPIPE